MPPLYAQESKATAATSQDSMRLRERATSRVLAFVDGWRATWTGSFGRRKDVSDDARLDDPLRGERTRRLDRPEPWTFGPVAMNTAYNFCRTDQFSWHHMGALSPVVTRVASATSARGYCPGWTYYRHHAPEMSRVLDSLLPAPGRAAQRAARATLLAVLDSASARSPGDEWIIGQRVRFLVDQGEASDAIAVASACRTAAWWCAMLVGYAHASDGDVVLASASFATAGGVLDPASRCAWESIALLLEPDARAAYVAGDCAAQAVINERFWWLADPLWSDTGNTRRVEHYRRRVAVVLHASLPRDELFQLTPATGSDAVLEVLVRYGWPSTMAYQPHIQRSNDATLRRAGSPPSGPYAMLEYQRSRTHVAPSWSAVVEPLRAGRVSWTLHEPDTATAPGGAARRAWDAERRFRRLDLTFDQLSIPSVRAHSVLWWPAEHFEPSRPLVQLADPQVALLRRREGVHVAVATAASDPLAHPDAAYGYEPRPPSSRSVLVSAQALLAFAPDSTMLVAAATGPAGGRSVLRRDHVTATDSSSPALLGVEVRSTGRGGGDARTRFGISVPAPLRTVAAGSISISAPVLLHADSIRAGEHTVDALLDAMRADSLVERRDRLGVYWETYGVAPGDTVDVAVRLERVVDPGVAARAAAAVGLATDPRGSLAISWREPRADRTTLLVESGRVPVVGRFITLDLSAQPPGTYRLHVEVRREGAPTLTSSRVLQVK